MNFYTQPLLQQATVGELLRRTREQKSVSIAHISRNIHVPEKYVIALEEGKYNDLPSPVYIKNYLKKYAKYLDLQWAQVERLYQQEISVYHDTPLKIFDQKRLQSAQETQSKTQSAFGSPFLIPRAVKIGLFLFVSIAVTTYFLVGVIRFLRPPTLTLTEPTQDQIVSDYELRVQGSSASGAIVRINNEDVTLDQNGFFSEEIILHEGVNTIRITAQTTRSRERVIVRYIIYEPNEQQEK